MPLLLECFDDRTVGLVAHLDLTPHQVQLLLDNVMTVTQMRSHITVIKLNDKDTPQIFRLANNLPDPIVSLRDRKLLHAIISAGVAVEIKNCTLRVTERGVTWRFTAKDTGNLCETAMLSCTRILMEASEPEPQQKTVQLHLPSVES